MNKIRFEDIKPGSKILIESKGEYYQAEVVSTTEGHLGLREVRITNGEVFSYTLQNGMYAYDAETKTEILLEGIEIKSKLKKREKEDV